jgi:hypothetical protein
MIRSVYVVVYLLALAVAVILLNANDGHGTLGLIAWGVASVALGLGTGRIAFSLLAFLAIPFAVPFGYPNDYEFSEPLPIWWGVAITAFFSAGLIFLAALVRLIAEKRRRPAPTRASLPARR